VIPDEVIQLDVEEQFDGMRLDRWLATVLDDTSRSAVRKWIDGGAIQGPQENLSPSDSVKTGETYTITIPSPPRPNLEPVDLNLTVIYEDDAIAVIHKPPGLAVHPGPGESKVTLINGLLYLWRNLPDHSSPLRPGIVHRLDSPTEGLLVIAKTESAHRKLSAAFENRNVEKEYCAWLVSTPEQTDGIIEEPIRRHPVDRIKMGVHPRGRYARTDYRIEKVIKSTKGRKFAFATIRIHTGRTHQIRVHMAHAGSPIVGDPLYSRSAKEFEKFGMLLVARKLAFIHPVTQERMEFSIDLPERFLDFEKKAHRL